MGKRGFKLFMGIAIFVTPDFTLVAFIGVTCAQPWSSLVVGDEQLDRPNSQTTIELWHASVA